MEVEDNDAFVVVFVDEFAIDDDADEDYDDV